jgi:two-component system, OmpR family, phosphate regulon sensor histidine kinase PhoR
MKSTRPFFAFRLFQWFVSRQVLISAGLFLFVDLGLIVWLQTLNTTIEAIRLSEKVAMISLAVSFLIVCFVSLFMTLRLVIPLGRLVEKTKRLRKMPFDSEEESEIQFTNDVPGEWYELERALNKLGRELQQKTIRLSREKTELRAVMSDISEAVLAVNRDRRILFYNPQLAVLFDLKNVSPDLTMSEILRSPDVLQAYNESLETGKAIRTVVTISVANSGLPRVFQLAVAPLHKKHNQEIYGAVGVFHDITEMKQAERIRIEFVANVSHELRTPLTSILGYVQTMQQDVDAKRYDELDSFLKIVSGNVERLKRLVDDLLDLSNLESGKALRVEKVGTRELTQSVLDQLSAKDHQVSLNFDTETVEADPQRAQQVLRNLLENAIRYVPKGKNIEVTWEETPDGGAALHVRDDGPGIPEEHRPRLFERFYRIDEGRSRNYGGTGIGLAIVKHIMQRHGGSVVLQSSLGEGSEFICQFPPAGVAELQ